MTFEELSSKCASLGRPLSDGQLEQLKKYCSFLMEKSEVMNLTAITDLDGIVEKHFFDSFLVGNCIDFSSKTLIDLGTGAGFPGLVLAVLYPCSKVTVLDATKKKIEFCKEAASLMGLTNVDFINARVEDLRKQRETFDVVVSRAFTSLSGFLEVGSPLAKVGGSVIAMKSNKGEEELKAASKAMRLLGLSLKSIEREVLPSNGDVRLNIVFEKKQKSPNRFPRDWATIISKPL